MKIEFEIVLFNDMDTELDRVRCRASSRKALHKDVTLAVLRVIQETSWTLNIGDTIKIIEVK